VSGHEHVMRILPPCRTHAHIAGVRLLDPRSSGTGKAMRLFSGGSRGIGDFGRYGRKVGDRRNASLDQRLLTHVSFKLTVSLDSTDWDTHGKVAKRTAARCRSRRGRPRFGLSSGQVPHEDYYVANKLIERLYRSCPTSTPIRRCEGLFSLRLMPRLGADVVPGSLPRDSPRPIDRACRLQCGRWLVVICTLSAMDCAKKRRGTNGCYPIRGAPARRSADCPTIALRMDTRAFLAGACYSPITRALKRQRYCGIIRAAVRCALRAPRGDLAGDAAADARASGPLSGEGCPGL